VAVRLHARALTVVRLTVGVCAVGAQMLYKGKKFFRDVAIFG
jgi:hypothetical protein